MTPGYILQDDYRAEMKMTWFFIATDGLMEEYSWK
jgi:hypothetical protein